ncbi:ATP-binding/permease protein CydD [Frondihabitans sp. 762G35]|uniref:thiol reductant ABC exporter subunit CydD n=1 Tax=Frondihabitans sp. 762G35 TaxID=1446794 RepID=UPI000D21DCA9|nr:thiol reductant ABC exporter subunit CydD [Frondihabitans sp. 762G35]ARC57123.1 ATP-binding/permease protein CydD [Frondihabitans sp. 762G35]
MKPLDPRLLRYASAARTFLVAGAGLGLLQTALTVAFAALVSRAVVYAVDGRTADLPGVLAALALVLVARSLVGWTLEAVAARTAARVKSQLRSRVVETVVRRGHAWLAERNSARLAILIGPGLDALDDYFARYLPQLILTALATPLLLVVLFTQDPLSGVIVLVTLPLIPLFMILIGWTTRAAQARQWDRLAALASAFLDAVNGLSTLKVFGRERRQIRRIGTLTDDYRVQTMKVLQVSFLSGFALEMAASLSVALVAVAIGIRLVEGSLALPLGLFLLLLTPEAYLPLRQVGANFHAASEGVAAADEVFEVLDDDAAASPAPAATAVSSSASSPTARAASAAPTDPDVLVVRDLTVDYGGLRATGPISFELPTGRVTAVTGPSGSGKSSLVAALLGVVPHGGSARWRDGGGTPTRAETAWSGQQPGLMSGSVAANVALGDEIDLDQVIEALTTAGGRDIDPGIELGAGGTGLSGGQAQRVALARALYRIRRRDVRLLLVDEPTSALDLETERELVDGLARIAAGGVAVLVVTHRPGVRDAADRVVTLTAQRVPSGATP